MHDRETATISEFSGHNFRTNLYKIYTKYNKLKGEYRKVLFRESVEKL